MDASTQGFLLMRSISNILLNVFMDPECLFAFLRKDRVNQEQVR